MTPRRFLYQVYRSVNQESKKDILELKNKIDLSKDIVTVGNHSFISLIIKDADPDKLKEGILHLLDYFEKVNNLVITNWFIEKYMMFGSHISEEVQFVSGIWITHRVKQ